MSTDADDAERPPAARDEGPGLIRVGDTLYTEEAYEREQAARADAAATMEAIDEGRSRSLPVRLTGLALGVVLVKLVDGLSGR